MKLVNANVPASRVCEVITIFASHFDLAIDITRLPSDRVIGRIIGYEMDAVANAHTALRVVTREDGDYLVWGHDGTTLNSMKLAANQLYIGGELIQLSVMEVPTGEAAVQVSPCTWISIVRNNISFL